MSNPRSLILEGLYKNHIDESVINTKKIVKDIMSDYDKSSSFEKSIKKVIKKLKIDIPVDKRYEIAKLISKEYGNDEWLQQEGVYDTKWLTWFES